MKIRNDKDNYIKLDNINSTFVTVSFEGKMTDSSQDNTVSFICEYSNGTTETKTITLNGNISTKTVSFDGGTVKSVSFVGVGSKNAGVKSISVTYEK